MGQRYIGIWEWSVLFMLFLSALHWVYWGFVQVWDYKRQDLHVS